MITAEKVAALPKAKGITFLGENVLAIAGDRKTQTRRVIDPKTYVWEGSSEDDATIYNQGDAEFPAMMLAHGKSPFGYVGAILYVKETWAVNGEIELLPWLTWKADGATVHVDSKYLTGMFWEERLGCPTFTPREGWRSPMMMPQWAARHYLRVTGLRVERVKDITGADAFAEGIQIPCFRPGVPSLRITGTFPPCAYPPLDKKETIATATADDWARCHYFSMWDTLHAKKGHPVSSNPYVWVYDFKRISLTELTG